jgi:truncated hemoglobin YjbI
MPDLKFAGTVALSLESSQLIGRTPDGVRLELRVHGKVAGPLLNGSFPSLAAHMLVDETGVGTLEVRAPVVLNDGAVLEIEATVRYDFGRDGYERAAGDDLPDSVVAGALRFLTGHPRYLWVNRALCLGVGALYSREKRIAYDLFLISSKALSADASPMNAAPGETSLYERLGGKDGLDRIAGDFFRGLETNPQLARQNPRIAAASAGTDPVQRNKRFAEFLCQLVKGPCEYTGYPLEGIHAPLAISGDDWTLGGEELVRALNKNSVKRSDQNELLALIEPLKPRIAQGRP